MKNKITIITFLCLLFGITIASIFSKNKVFSENENRYLSQKPELSIENIVDGSFESEYEEYVSDQFAARDKWIWLKSSFELLVNKKDINNVYIANDNYFIEKHTDSELLSEQALKNYDFVSNFISNTPNSKLMVIPTAFEILSQKLPSYAYGSNQRKIIDDIYKKAGNTNIIDVAGALEKKRDEYIFYRTDHHWTTLGAYYAYEEYARNLAIVPNKLEDYNIKEATSEFYGTISSKVNILREPDSIYLYELKNPVKLCIIYNQSDEVNYSIYNMDYLEKKDKYGIFFGGNEATIEIDTDVQNDKSILIIKDSYANCFIPFLINHYNKIDVIDLRYYNDSVNSLIKKNNYTDILVMYSITNLATDKNLFKLTR